MVRKVAGQAAPSVPACRTHGQGGGTSFDALAGLAAQQDPELAHLLPQLAERPEQARGAGLLHSVRGRYGQIRP